MLLPTRLNFGRASGLKRGTALKILHLCGPLLRNSRWAIRHSLVEEFGLDVVQSIEQAYDKFNNCKDACLAVSHDARFFEFGQ